MGVVSYKLRSRPKEDWVNGWLIMYRDGQIKAYHRKPEDPKREIPEGDVATVKLMEGTCHITLILPPKVGLKYKEEHTTLIKPEGKVEDFTIGGKLILSPPKPLQLISMPKQNYEAEHLAFVFSYSKANVEPIPITVNLNRTGEFLISM